jgi:hypothetical protein
MAIDFLFQDIISAPTADEYKVELRARQVRERFGSNVARVVENASGAVQNSVSIARNRISPALPVSRPVPRESSISWRDSIKERFVANVTTRSVPPGVVASYASTTMMLTNSFADKVPASAARRSMITPISVSTLLATDTSENEEFSLYDSVERGDMDAGVDDGSSLGAFFAMLYKQCAFLNGPAKTEFQERWGIKSAVDNQAEMFGSDDEAVPSGIFFKIWNKVCFWKKKKTREQILSEAILETSQSSNEKIKKLKVAPDIQVGLEIMHLFIIDLLG